MRVSPLQTLVLAGAAATAVLYNVAPISSHASGMLAQQPVVQQPAQPPPQPPPPQQTAPEQTPPQQPRPAFRTEANYVRVDAYALRAGVPVDDLRAEEFEVLEDGVPQKIQSFEHVVITPAGPQASRIEPNSVRQGEQMAAMPRNRVFVIFLDVPHVDVSGSHAIQEPLIRLMDRVLGADDLVAVMTPSMSPDQITFARKTEVIQRGLRENWPWGQRHSILPMDRREEEYEACYPPLPGESTPSALAQRMIDRRRERMVLEALEDLVRYLGGIREERKAVLAVTEGWRLYRPDRTLTDLRPGENVPGTDPVAVDPSGKLTTRPERNAMNAAMPKSRCDGERMELAAMDNERYFRDLLDTANRANASFYPIDPRGLAVFDSPIGPRRPPTLAVDQDILQNKLHVLRTLAENTDGLAVVNSNDIEKGLRRIAADLTSYYLLGYYSTNAKLDGSFRSIKVRVRRPGVDVRARRGYRAATQEEVLAARAAASAPTPAASSTLTAALATLSRIRPEARLRVHAAAVPGAAGTAIRIAAELPLSAPEAAAGGTAHIEVAGGGASRSTEVTMKPGERTFLTSLTMPGAAESYDVRVRLSGGTLPLTDTIRLESGSKLGSAIAFRRGPSTGNRWLPAGDFRFSRTERLRLEVPLREGATPGPARVLDKAGTGIELPVTIGERVDAEGGQRWLTADLTLASLGAGDYVVEVGIERQGQSERVMTAVRVTR